MPAMTTWMVVAANGLPVDYRELGVGACLHGEQSAGKQRQRNEQGFHDANSIL